MTGYIYRDWEEREAELGRREAAIEARQRFGGPHQISKEEYRASEGLSTSQLKKFATSEESIESPADDEDRACLQFGTRLEAFLFDASYRYVVQPSDIKRRAGHEWEQFADDHRGFDIFREREHDELLEAVARVCEVPGVEGLLTGMRSTCWWWHDHVDGQTVLRRGEIDVYHPAKLIVDVKTTRDQRRREFAAQAERLRYHWQLASYQQAVEASGGGRLPCVLLAIRNKPPYTVEQYEIPQRWLDRGLEEVRETMAAYLKCQELGFWRSPTWGRISILDEPMWARRF